MFRVATDRYVARIRAAIAGDAPRGIAGVRHAFDAVVRLTATDPERRGCLVINAVAEAAALSPPMRRRIGRGLLEMRRFLRDRLREAQEDTGTAVDLAPIASLLFAAAVAIRVLGRAGQHRRLLQSIADGAVAAARQALDDGERTLTAPRKGR
jgi:TetR/AcrR family transcriptional repressor of nem operon